MTVNRTALGMRSRNAGLHFEGMITAACRHYEKKQVAVIEKTPEPMRPLKPYGDRRKGQFIAVYEKQAQPDFKGVLLNGRSVIFEAKHTDRDRISQNVVTETQRENYCANRIVICQDCGAVLDPFDALERVAAHMELYAEYQEKALCKAKAFGELADKEFRRRMRNKAFKEMDVNYQKGLLPICPECEQVFDPMRIARWTRGRADEH